MEQNSVVGILCDGILIMKVIIGRDKSEISFMFHRSNTMVLLQVILFLLIAVVLCPICDVIGFVCLCFMPHQSYHITCILRSVLIDPFVVVLYHSTQPITHHQKCDNTDSYAANDEVSDFNVSLHPNLIIQIPKIDGVVGKTKIHKAMYECCL